MAGYSIKVTNTKKEKRLGAKGDRIFKRSMKKQRKIVAKKGGGTARGKRVRLRGKRKLTKIMDKFD